MNALRTVLSFFFLCAAVSACRTETSHNGIGLPGFSDRSNTPVWPVGFTRVYAPAASIGNANAFIEIENTGSTAIDLAATPAYLANAFGSADLPTVVWEPNARIQISGNAAAALNLHANAGEVALFDHDLHVHAYSAWGSDPNQWSTSFVALAQNRGLGTAWRGPLPYPVDASVAVALDGNATELCASSNPQSTSADNNFWQPCPSTTQHLVLTRIQPNPLSSEGIFVELYNPSTQVLDLFGVQLCVDTICHPISTMPSNGNSTQHLLQAAQTSTDGTEDSARVLVHINPSWSQTTHTELALDFPSIASFAGREWSLAAPGAPPTDPNGILWSYARFESDNTPSMLAQQTFNNRALWNDTPLAAPRFRDESLAQSLPTQNDVAAPEQWAPSTSLPGTSLNDARTPWRSCAAPSQPATAAALRIQKIAVTDNIERVILENTGTVALDLATYNLVLGDQTLALATTPTLLQAAYTYWLELSETATCSGNEDRCWPNTQNYLKYGQAALQDGNGQITNFVQWQSSQAPAQSLAQAAVDANIWPQTTCLIDDFLVDNPNIDSAIERMPAQTGQSPADYRLYQGI